MEIVVVKIDYAAGLITKAGQRVAFVRLKASSDSVTCASFVLHVSVFRRTLFFRFGRNDGVS